MKKSVLFFAVVMLCIACSQKEDTAAKAVKSEKELIERGRYLTIIGGCNDCHSPKVMTPHGPEPDPSRLLSGHPQNEKIPAPSSNKDWILFSPGLTAAVGPWGVSYAANLTPDDTGTGNWTFEQFKTALRKGKFKGLEGSRDLLPPMPWQMLRNMSDDDMLAIFTYLRSLPKVNNLVPSPQPSVDLAQLKNEK